MKFIELKDYSGHYFYVNTYDIILIEYYDIDFSKIYLRNLCSLLAISVYYILKHKQNTKENALYDLFKKYGYIKVNKTTTIIATKEQLQKLATTNDYIELIELNKGAMDLPNRYESAQKILLENPDLKQITRKEVSITYPKLHQKY